jgi:hypothetical protein
MTSRRSISWSSALQSLRADRGQTPPAERRLHLQATAFAKLAFHRAQALAHDCPMIVFGAYDRRTIMRLAAVAANARRIATGETWRTCISAALRGTWAAAKASRQSAERQQSCCFAGRSETSVSTGSWSKFPGVRQENTCFALDVLSKQPPL